MSDAPRDPTAGLLALLCVGALIVTSSWIVRPFAAPAIWAVTIAVVTWPWMLGIERRLTRKRALTTTLMVLLLVLLVTLPLLLAAGVLVANAGAIAEGVRWAVDVRIGPAPAWLADVPLLGASLASWWNDTAATGMDGMRSRLVPYAGGLTSWFLGRLGTVGFLAVQFALTLLFTAFFYLHGEALAAAALRLGRRLGGSRGQALVLLAARTIRAVALGVVLTAAIQSLLGGLGIAVAGVPFAGVVTAVLFVFCIAQIGMLLPLMLIVAWVWWQGSVGTAAILFVWSLAASLIDQLLRPLLVNRGIHLPLLLIFVGVVGGLVAFGLLGLFVGPVILAVAYTLLRSWMDDPMPPTGRPDPSTAD